MVDSEKLLRVGIVARRTNRTRSYHPVSAPCGAFDYRDPWWTGTEKAAKEMGFEVCQTCLRMIRARRSDQEEAEDGSKR